MNKEIEVLDLGRMDYQKAWDFQENLFQKIISIKSLNRKEESALNTPNYLLFVEHPHVFTLGKSGHLENLLVSEEKLKEKGATFYKINRGGDITYHGPGQIVMYPILDLENFFTDIHKYMRLLEEVVILALQDFGLQTERSHKETGVWLDVGTPFARKICALGVRASRWVTMHGLALNVSPDMGFFDLMVPCGIRDKAVTSMKIEWEAKGKSVVCQERVKERLLFHFLELFGAEPILKSEFKERSVL